MHRRFCTPTFKNIFKNTVNRVKRTTSEPLQKLMLKKLAKIYFSHKRVNSLQKNVSVLTQ